MQNPTKLTNAKYLHREKQKRFMTMKHFFVYEKRKQFEEKKTNKLPGRYDVI